MAGFIEGVDRGQLALLPESLDQWVDDSNSVRVIDAFVEALDLDELGFKMAEPADIGRPGYSPALHLKLYIYGYLNRIQSSRRLERECRRNLEVMWLTERLAPDHKTIADFRKDNGAAIKKVCAKFVELCRQMGLLAKASVAIDGSKFKAVNNRDKNFTEAKLEKRRKQLEESVARYLSQLDTADLHEPSETIELKKTYLKEKLEKLKTEMGKLEAIEKQVAASPDKQISLTDPDSRSMATSGRGSGVVGYNVQTAVDTEYHLIVHHEVTNVGNDTAHLADTAKATKAALDVDELEVVADRGYFDSEEIKSCDDAGITVTMPKRDDVGCEIGRPLRQAGLHLFGRRRCLSLSGWREAPVSFYERGERPEAASLLDECVPQLRAESEMHKGAATPDHALGARGGARSGARQARQKP